MMKWLKNWLGLGPIGPVASTDVHVQQALYATVVRACENCGAAGVDKFGVDVGSICPSCGASRPRNEILGQIWRKFKNAG